MPSSFDILASRRNLAARACQRFSNLFVCCSHTKNIQQQSKSPTNTLSLRISLYLKKRCSFWQPAFSLRAISSSWSIKKASQGDLAQERSCSSMKSFLAFGVKRASFTPFVLMAVNQLIISSTHDEYQLSCPSPRLSRSAKQLARG